MLNKNYGSDGYPTNQKFAYIADIYRDKTTGEHVALIRESTYWPISGGTRKPVYMLDGKSPPNSQKHFLYHPGFELVFYNGNAGYSHDPVTAKTIAFSEYKKEKYGVDESLYIRQQLILADISFHDRACKTGRKIMAE